MSIRKAKLKDCEAIYKLCKTPALLNPSGEPPKLWWIQSFVKEKQMLYVAEAGKKIVGFVMAEELTGKGCIIWMMAVTKAFQNKGIGARLYQTIEDECKKRKIRAIVLYSYIKNKGISKQLQRAGFQKGSHYEEYIKFM
ncbi:MAG: GNAT family N-acetyltransferase [Patescibacteria group bacterium]|jgi:ribosomal protein S18 acetylase RimI-like enzyme